MRLDISLLDELNRPVAILDTKWKLLDSGNPLASLSSADLYQLSTYASAYRCDQVMLLYPEQAGFRGKYQVRLNLDRPVTLTVIALPLYGKGFSLPVRTTEVFA